LQLKGEAQTVPFINNSYLLALPAHLRTLLESDGHQRHLPNRDSHAPQRWFAIDKQLDTNANNSNTRLGASILIHHAKAKPYFWALSV
jgi:hypothetical protein